MRNALLFISFILLTLSSSTAQNIVGLYYGGELEYKQLELKKPAFSKSYLLADDSIKYDLGEVGYYQNEKGYFLRRELNTGGYEFIRREQTGEIELYNVIRDTYN